MTEKIKVMDGPAKGRKVSARMGDRWPWVTALDLKKNYVLGWYELRDGAYW